MDVSTLFKVSQGDILDGLGLKIIRQVDDETRRFTVYLDQERGHVFFGFFQTKGALSFPLTRDWLKNFRLWKKGLSVGSDKYRACAGFVEEYKTFREIIFETVRVYQPSMIGLGGTSQGGAHVTLAARDIMYNFPEVPVRGVSFGGPQVYTPSSAEEFDHALAGHRDAKFIRVTVPRDPIVWLPSFLLNYAHVSRQVVIGKPRWWVFPDPEVHPRDYFHADYSEVQL